MRYIFLILQFLVFIFIFSCGNPSPPPLKEVSSKKTAHAVEVPRPEGEGQFLAVLKPLNEFVAGKVTGAFTWSKEEDEIVADVRFNGGAATAMVIHEQSVHVGRRCPDESDDLNDDGYIDSIEAEKVLGKVLLPLDADLNNQIMGHGTFPLADDFGSYIYSKVGSFEKMMIDLRELDLNTDDPFAKLGPDKKFNIKGMTVAIKGVSHTAIIPTSVASNTSFANYQTLPIACGIIDEIKKIPGEFQTEETNIPVPPTGHIEERPEDDGATIPVPSKEVPETDGEEDGDNEAEPDPDNPENYGDNEEDHGVFF